MKTLRRGLTFVTCGMILAALCAADNAAGPIRTELKRADLSQTESMEVISSIVEFPPGTEVRRHVHHGVESGYVLQGAMIQRPGSAPEMVETGNPILNLRDVPHGGFKIVGDRSLKIFSVHVVDKGKPLYEYTK